jgi:hypothetical protein
MLSRAELVVTASVGVLAVAVGAGAVSSPLLGVGLAITPPLLWWLCISARARFLIVIIGALLVFQSQSSVGKYCYITLAGVCFFFSAMRVARTSDPVVRAFRSMIPTGIILGVLLAFSMFVSLSQGARLADWSDDILPYAMLVVLPIVGLDAAPEIGENAVGWLVGGLGIVTAIGFALDWLNRRGVSSLDVGRVILATMTLPALGFAYSTVQAARARRPLKWMLVSLVIVALFLVTGTRTSLVFAACYLGIIGSAKRGRYSPIRVFGLAGTLVVSVLVAVPFIGTFVLNDPTFLSSRIASASSVFQGGNDQSYQIRSVSYSSAQSVFFAHPWFGGGPGHLYPGGTFTLDTPWLVPAKFGVIGTLAIVLYLLAIAWGVRNTSRVAGYLPIHTTARGWGLILVALTPFGTWTEDKGTALALTLLVACVAAESRRQVSRKDEGPTSLMSSSPIAVLEVGSHQCLARAICSPAGAPPAARPSEARSGCQIPSPRNPRPSAGWSQRR